MKRGNYLSNPGLFDLRLGISGADQKCETCG